MKDKTCFAKMLDEYPLQSFNEQDIEGNTVPPIRRNTFKNHEKCNKCYSRAGIAKNIYSSSYEANLQADKIFNDRSISLRVYKCVHHSGWHLTKQPLINYFHS